MASDLRIALTTTLNDRLVAPLRRALGEAGRTLDETGRKLDNVDRSGRRAGGTLIGLRGPERATRQVDELARKTERATRLAQGLEKAWNTAGNIIKGVGLAIASAQAARMVLADPMMRAAGYDTNLRNLANTAYAGESDAAKRQGLRGLDAAITEAVKRGGGTREDALAALGQLIASGQFGDADQSMGALPTLVKTAKAGEASTTDIAGIAIAAVSQFGIRADRLDTNLGRAMASGQMGQFELRDMASSLPSQMSAARAIGMSGEDDFMRLLAANQASRTTAGTSSQAATNLQALLTEINSVTTTATLAKLGVDKKGTMDAAIARGTDPLTAFLNMVDQIVARDPQFQAVRKEYQAAGSDEERRKVAESRLALMQGGVLGQISGRQEATLALSALLLNRDTMSSQVGELRNAGAGTIEEAHRFLREGAGYKYEANDFARQVAQTEAMNKLNDAGGAAAAKLTELYEKFPELGTAIEGSKVGLTALAAAAGTAAGALALLGLARGGRAVAGGAAAAAAGAAGNIVRPLGSHLTGALPAAASAAAPAAAAGSLAAPIAMGAAGVVAPIIAIAARESALNSESGLQKRIASFDQRIIKLTDSIDYGRAGVATDKYLQDLEQQRAELIADRQALMETLEQLTQAVRDQNQKPVEVTVNMDGREVASGVNGSNAKDARRQ